MREWAARSVRTVNSCVRHSASRASSRSLLSLIATPPKRIASWIAGASRSKPHRWVTRGWETTREISAAEALRPFEALPLAAVLHTCIERDGMLGGAGVRETEALARTTRLAVIASGGIGSLEDLLELARTRVISAAVLGRALHEGRVDLAEALAEVARC